MILLRSCIKMLHDGLGLVHVDTLRIPGAVFAVCAALSVLAAGGIVLDGWGAAAGGGVSGRAASFSFAALILLAKRLGFKLVPVSADICEPERFN